MRIVLAMFSFVLMCGGIFIYYNDDLHNTNLLTYDSIDKLERLFDVNLKCGDIEEIHFEYEANESTVTYFKVKVSLEHAGCVLQLENFQEEHLSECINFDEIPISSKSLSIITEKGYMSKDLIFVSLIEKDFNIKTSNGTAQTLISIPRYIFKVDEEVVEIVIVCIFPEKLDFEGIKFPET